MSQAIDYSVWANVPNVVAALVENGLKLRATYEKIAAVNGDLLGSALAWHVGDDMLHVYRLKKGNAVALSDRIRYFDARERQPNLDEEMILKQAAIPGLSHVSGFLHSIPTGKPTPLSHAIASSVMLGGLGYGTGALLENLFPETYLQRGKLRRNLALAGALGGIGLGAGSAYATSKKLRQGFWPSVITPNDTPVQEYPGAPEKQGVFQVNISGIGLGPTPQLYSPSVSVPQFNNTTWNDARNYMMTGNPAYTPPHYAAMATGIMSGASAAQNSSIIRPVDVIRTIASAGVGLATANVAGRALSAMAGLTPAGQEKLQDLGLWGGMLHSVISPLAR
jgi:hypothetical protein